MKIALTGTPGTGKTTIAALLPYRVIDINSLVKGGMNLGKDPDRGCLEADMDALAGCLEKLDGCQETVILEGHFSHHFADWAIVLRLAPPAWRRVATLPAKFRRTWRQKRWMSSWSKRQSTAPGWMRSIPPERAPNRWLRRQLRLSREGCTFLPVRWTGSWNFLAEMRLAGCVTGLNLGQRLLGGKRQFVPVASLQKISYSAGSLFQEAEVLRAVALCTGNYHGSFCLAGICNRR